MLSIDPALAFETDGTFGGLLSAYAVAYRRGALPAEVRLAGHPAPGALFGEAVRVGADAALAVRVERGLERARPGLVGRLHRAFLSERDGMEVSALRLIDAVANRGADAAEDWTFGPAVEVSRWSGRVGREAHRMEAFVRFERHADPSGVEAERYVAWARPEYHVLPIIGAHFEARYPTLAWRIVDVRRGLALVHTPEPERAPGAPASQIVPASALDLPDQAADEAHYQTMWRAYFRAVTIPERRNLKLHLRHVPKRYWPYLTEKQGAVSSSSTLSS
jgi:probable DNA metabolism protein